MRVLVIGGGGREHAICEAFARSSDVSGLFCANGNAGIAAVADCVPIEPTEIDSLVAFAASERIDLTFVGGETALAAGIVDNFDRAGLRITGPTKAASRLEASKRFAKDFMLRHRIPTAEYRVAGSVSEAIAILESGIFGDVSSPVVVKADGLAGGKGVVVCYSRSEGVAALLELIDLAGAEAASSIVLEEKLTGREVSLLAFCDGRGYSTMPAVRDHKRVGDGDTGPNTGGMGTVCDRSLLSAEDLAFVESNVLQRTLDGCRAEGFPFSGILFIGLMMTPDGPRVLEYNVRFGDPETQVLLPLLETDFAAVSLAMSQGTLADIEVRWSSGSSACVVLAARGYPASPQKGDIIYGIDLAERHQDVRIFHAGTAVDDRGHFLTASGRVLNVTAVGSDLAQALDRAYQAVNDISWNGMQFRHDIGR
jgi:phosphoribosylamine--glycine ligase